MSIRLKIILITLAITIFGLFPFSFFLILNHEKQTVNRINGQGKAIARILAHSTLNILMMNGGEVTSSSVDVTDMIQTLHTLKQEGLVYADAVFLSEDRKRDGTILSSIAADDDMYQKIIPLLRNNRESDLAVLKKGKSGHYEPGPAEDGERYIIFTAPGLIRGRHAVCAGRIVFSRSHILRPVERMKKILILASIIIIFVVSVIGIFFSRIISRPVKHLEEGARRIENGDFSYTVPERTRDELGSLAATFNSMTRIINEKISELETKNLELSKMDKLKDEFLANTSHELRTPIHGIIGIADSLKSGVYGPLRKEIIANLDLVVKSGKRLSRLVDDILDYSRLKHRDIDLKKVEIDISSLTDVVISIVSPLARNKFLAIHNTIPPGEIIAWGDEGRIQQVLFNLLGNAITFSDEGDIIVRAKIDDESRNTAIVTVEDSGIGIPADKIKEIFDSFSQVDGSNTRNYGGTGLGLAIARDLVHLHGGRIWVESVPGQGATFYFSLPLADRVNQAVFKEPSETEKSSSPESIIQEVSSHLSAIVDTGDDNGRPTVLVVDDEEVNLQVLSNYLSLEGYRVQMASGGIEALDIVKNEGAPDIILLDVMMPFMSGYEVCRILRGQYPAYQLPILMLTAKNRPQDLSAGFDAGANDYITKPFEKQELMTRVKNLVDLKKNVEYFNELTVIKEELIIAKTIQEAIIPLNDPQLSSLKLKSKYIPMKMVGGDFFDFHQGGENDPLGIFIADVTGHGIPAALIASMLKAAFALSREMADRPSTLLENLNNVLCNHISSRFVTACYGIIDTQNMTLTLSTAAHWPVYLCKKDSGSIKELRTRGTFMGIKEDITYIDLAIDIAPGDRIFFLTDGIIEERNSNGEIFGEKRFLDFIISTKDSTIDDIPDSLIKTVTEWSGCSEDDSFDDDISIVAVDVL